MPKSSGLDFDKNDLLGRFSKNKKEEKVGGKITLKSIGNEFKSAGSKIKKAFTSPAAKKVGSFAIHQGIPALTSALGSAGAEFLAPELGPVSGFVGAQAGNAVGTKIANLVGNKTGLGLIRDLHHHIVASARARGKNISDIADGITEHNVIFPVLHIAHNGLHNTKMGKGFFDKVKKVAGIAWKTIAPAAKMAGKHAVSLGADALGEAVSAYTGNPAFGDMAKNVGKSLGDQAVDSIKENYDAPKKVQKKDVKKVVKNALDLAQNEYIEEPPIAARKRTAGTGIHPHYRRRGGAIAPTESQITYVGGNNDFNTPVQLGSPYQYSYSPAMNPYFEDVNQLQGYNPIGRYGGSFQPAGTYGGSMMVHHIHHHSLQPVARRRGGSFLAAGGP
jgi:hypothetical protein